MNFKNFLLSERSHTNKLYSDSVYMPYEKSQSKGTKCQIILGVGEGKRERKLTSMDMKTLFGLIDTFSILIVVVFP